MGQFGGGGGGVREFSQYHKRELKTPDRDALMEKELFGGSEMKTGINFDSCARLPAASCLLPADC